MITEEEFNDLCELKIEQFRAFHNNLFLIHIFVRMYFDGRQNKTIKIKNIEDKRKNKSPKQNENILINTNKMIKLFGEIFDESLPDPPNFLIGSFNDYFGLLSDMNIDEIDNINSLYHYAQACLFLGQYYYSLKKRVPLAMDNLYKIECLSYRVPRYAFECAGYWRRRLTDDIKMLQAKKDSGLGQKKAEKERQNKLADGLQKFMNKKTDDIYVDKGDFVEILNTTFVGRENYPRHYQTIKKYKKAVEQKLKKKIHWK